MARIRKRRLATLIVVIVCLVFLPELIEQFRGRALFTPTSSGVIRASFDRIQKGMPEDEVEKLLGGPPGNYTNRPDPQAQHGISFRRYWYGDEGNIIIELTWDDHVADTPRHVAHKLFVPARD